MKKDVKKNSLPDFRTAEDVGRDISDTVQSLDGQVKLYLLMGETCVSIPVGFDVVKRFVKSIKFKGINFLDIEGLKVGIEVNDK